MGWNIGKGLRPLNLGHRDEHCQIILVGLFKHKLPQRRKSPSKSLILTDLLGNIGLKGILINLVKNRIHDKKSKKEA